MESVNAITETHLNQLTTLQQNLTEKQLIIQGNYANMKEITEQIVSLKKSFEEAPAQGKTKEEKEAFKAKMNELVKKSLEIRQKIDVSHVEIANINQEILKTVGQVTQELEH